MNYTPLNIASFQRKDEIVQADANSFDIGAVFLGLIGITLTILAALLFILIQKKLQELSYVPFFA
jgi:hypothetical protein